MLRGIRSDIKFVISSGYMDEDQRERLRKCKVDGFLDKPYRDKDIIELIGKIPSS